MDILEAENNLDTKSTENLIEIKIEDQLSKEKRTLCRDIVQEIKNVKIGQRGVLFLIQLLALELEDAEISKNIVNAVKNNREKFVIDRSTEEEKSLILNGDF